MKKIITTLLLSTVLFASYGYSQTNVNKTSTEKASENEAVLNQLKIIYGEYYTSHILNNPSQIQFYTDFYKRCEIIDLKDAPISIANISTLQLKGKYNPEHIKHDFSETFDASTFIILKYHFDFYETSDTYYQIYSTDKALKINKLN